MEKTISLVCASESATTYSNGDIINTIATNQRDKQRVFFEVWRTRIVEGLDKRRSCGNAWMQWKLWRALRAGSTEFWYLKIDGTLRQAFGTLSPTRMGLENMPKGCGRNTSRAVFNYFDLEKNGWRCFRRVNLICVGSLEEYLANGGERWWER